MKYKQKKYGFLEYALYTLNRYFFHILIHHIPRNTKIIAIKLNKSNIDDKSILQLKLKQHYGGYRSI